jgi:hypothetical protein
VSIARGSQGLRVVRVAEDIFLLAPVDMTLQYVRIRVRQMHHAIHVSVSADGRQESAGADHGHDGGKDLLSGHRGCPSSARSMRLDRPPEVAVQMNDAELISVMIVDVGVHGLRVVFSSCVSHDCKMSIV